MTHITRFSIRFDETRTARAVRVGPQVPPADALAALQLPPYTGVVVMHGGAAGMNEDALASARRCLAGSLTPLAEQRRYLVVDGGTRVGVPAILGNVRRTTGGTFPLVGVVPEGQAFFPGKPAPDADHAPLDPDHSHFILVEANDFGEESGMLVGTLAGSGVPGLALVINGGQIVLQEVLRQARQGNPIVALKGSGRMADQLADPASPERARLPAGTRLVVADVEQPAALAALLERTLTRSA